MQQQIYSKRPRITIVQDEDKLAVVPVDRKPFGSDDSNLSAESSWTRRFNSSKAFLANHQPRLKHYTETKCGGHVLDHRRMIAAAPMRTTRVSPKRALDQDSVRHYDLYGCGKSTASSTTHQQDYAPIKVGGHALDHIRFLGKGIPSRPILVPHTITRKRRATGSITTPITHTPSSTVCNQCFCVAAEKSLVELNCQHSYCLDCSGRAEARFVQDKIEIQCPACQTFVPFLIDIAEKDADKIKLLLLSNRRHHHRPTRPVFPAALFLGSSVVGLSFLKEYMALNDRHRHYEELELEPPVETATDLGDGAGWKKRLAYAKNKQQHSSKLLRYSYVKTLGKGNFAQVFLMKRTGSNRYCVLKESDKLEAAANEVNILNRIVNRNVIKIQDFFVEKVGHQQLAYIELEYCESGDLKSLIEASGPLALKQVRCIVQQLVNGLASLHAQKIVHRDLKPANILFSQNMKVVKIADLGVSTDLGSRTHTQNAAGTFAFMAPEVRQYFVQGGGVIKYDTRADIWSLGAVVVAMLTGNTEPNIASRPLDEVLESILETIGDDDDDQYLGTLIEQSLATDPSKRASLSQLTRLLSTLSKI